MILYIFKGIVPHCHSRVQHLVDVDKNISAAFVIDPNGKFSWELVIFCVMNIAKAVGARKNVNIAEDTYDRVCNYYKICFAEIVCMLHSTDSDADH